MTDRDDKLSEQEWYTFATRGVVRHHGCMNGRCLATENLWYVMIGGTATMHVQVLLCETCARGVWRPEGVPFEQIASPVIDLKTS